MILQCVDDFDKTAEPKHLLWCLLHLKQYLTKGVMTSLVDAAATTI